MKARLTEETATHNHLFWVGFSVNSNFADSDQCLKHETDEVWARLLERTASLIADDGDNIEDALDCSGSYEHEIEPKGDTK